MKKAADKKLNVNGQGGAEAPLFFELNSTMQLSKGL